MTSLSPVSAPLALPRRRSPAAPRWDRDALLTLVAARFAVPRAELTAPTRRRADAAFARQAAMYLAHVRFSATFSEIGRAFGRDRTTAAHACRLVEGRRDDPSIDALFDAIEAECASLGAAGRAGASEP